MVVMMKRKMTDDKFFMGRQVLRMTFRCLQHEKITMPPSHTSLKLKIWYSVKIIKCSCILKIKIALSRNDNCKILEELILAETFTTFFLPHYLSGLVPPSSDTKAQTHHRYFPSAQLRASHVPSLEGFTE